MKDGSVWFTAYRSYEIDLTRIYSPFSVLSWVQHLGQKNWITADALSCFVTVVCKAKGWSEDLQNAG